MISNRSKIFCWSAIALLAACKSKLDDGKTDAQSNAATTASASPSARIAAEAKKVDAGPALDKKQSAEFLAAMAKARGDVAKKNFEAAIAAYDQAIKISPHDAAAMGERGYARYLSGDDLGAERDLVAARSFGATPKVAAEIWFNLGLARLREGDGDGARSAFATSQSIAPSAAAEKKLQGLSTCTAELSTSDTDLPKEADFQAIATLLQIDPAVEADAGAKGAVCIHSYTADGSGDDHDVCNGAPPWLVSHDHLSFFEHVDAIFPASTGKGQMYVADLGQEGDWPAHCTGAYGMMAKMDGKFGWTTTTYNAAGGVMIQKGEDTKGAQGLVDQGDYFCANGVGSVDDAFYDLDTGKALLHVHRPIAINAVAAVATVAMKNGVVSIGGPGCNQTVDLKAGKFSPDSGK
jgi:tetratricopeptide (TPR) repeat protein